MSSETRHIAMWSGPRNLSTAMMRSFENRDDCAVWDEPFYAAYLVKTGLDHPMRQEIVDAGETDYGRVADACLGAATDGSALFYQKHMTHHMLPGVDMDWSTRMQNVFLIRAPERVLASYHAKREDVSLDDIGFRQQAEIFDRVADRTGEAPAVIEAEDVRATPEPILRKLCQRLGIGFQDRMLSWPPGRRDSDGAWAPHWYASVENSTGFAPPDLTMPDLSDDLARIADQARPFFDRLRAHRIT